MRHEPPSAAERDAIYRQVLRNSGIAVFRWDATTGDCLWCSEELAALHGLTVERYLELRGTEELVRRSIHPDDLDHYVRSTEAAIRRGGSYEIVYRFHAADGRLRHVLELAECELNPVNGHRILVGCIVDQTAQREAAAELERRAALYRQASAVARVGAFAWDLTAGRALWISEEGAALQGWDVPAYMRDCATDAQLLESIHPEDRPAFVRQMTAAATTLQPYRLSYRQRHRDGHYQHIEEAAEVVRNPSDGHLHIIGCIIDVTEQRRIEAALREANERLDARVHERTAALEAALARAESVEQLFSGAAAALHEGLAIYDRDDRLIYHNARYPELLDPSLRAALRIGARWPEILDRALELGPVYHAEMGADFAQRRRDWPSGPGRNVELRFADGRWVDVSEALLPDGGFVVLLVDVSARRQAEADARAMSERFVAAAESLVDGLLIFDPDDRIAFYNSRYPEHLAPSLRAALAPGKRFPDWIREGLANGPIYHPDMGPDFPQRRLAMRALERSDHEHRLADGRWVRIREARMPDGGRVLLTSDVTLRRESERERRLLATVVEQAGDSVEIADPDYRLVYVNPAFTRLTGWRSAEVLGRSPGSFLRSGRHDEAFFAEIDAVVRGGGIWTGRIVSRHKDGRELEQDAVISPLLDEHGRLAHFVAVKRDVTEMVRTARALAASEARLAAFLRHAPVGMYVKDREGRYLMANPEMAKVFGRPVEEVIGKSATEVFGQTEAEMIAGFDRRILETGEAAAVEEFLEGLDAYAWSLVFRFPIRDEAGEIVQIGGFDVDITPQKRAQAAVAQSEQRFRALTEAHPMPLVAVRLADRRPLFASPAFLDALGTTLEGMLEGDIARFYADPAMRARVFERLTRERRIDALELELARADGSRFPALMRCVVTRLGDDDVVLSSFVDLTAQKSAEAEIERQREALRHSERMSAMGSLLAGVAHELNNPLSVVIGQTDLLHETAADPATRARAQRIKAAADRCGRVIRTFLAMARRKSADRRPVEVATTIREVLELTAYGLRADGIEVSLAIDPDLPPILAEEGQIDQVLLNLLINAQQALREVPGPRRIRIAAAREEMSVRIDVDDSGPGVPSAIRGRVFDPFFTTKPVGVGTGVGLSICHGVVEAHGGRIAVGDAPLGGARFTVWLGVAGPELRTAGGTAAAPGPSAGRVLVVDDEPEIGELVAEVLGRDGVAAAIATDGQRGLALLAERPFDLVLCDLRMPGIDGPRLLELARSRGHRTPFLFMTGDTLSAAALLGGGETVLEKPLHLDALRRAVAEALRRV
jgi:PAS domain S-box-containing protein